MTGYLNHIHHQHYRHHETWADWDRNKVILGLLEQPLVHEAWRRILSLFSISEDTEPVWGLSAANDLQIRLVRGEETPEALAKAAFKSAYASRLHQDDSITQGLSVKSLSVEAQALRESIPGNLLYRHASHNFPGYEAEERFNSLRLDDNGRRDPWDPLRILEGATLPINTILKNGSLHAKLSIGKKQQTSAGSCDETAEDIRRNTSALEVVEALGNKIVTGSTYGSSQLQPSLFPSSTHSASSSHSKYVLSRNASCIAHSIEEDPLFDNSIIVREACFISAQESRSRVRCEETDMHVSPCLRKKMNRKELTRPIVYACQTIRTKAHGQSIDKN